MIYQSLLYRNIGRVAVLVKSHPIFYYRVVPQNSLKSKKYCNMERNKWKIIFLELKFWMKKKRKKIRMKKVIWVLTFLIWLTPYSVIMKMGNHILFFEYITMHRVPREQFWQFWRIHFIFSWKSFVSTACVH